MKTTLFVLIRIIGFILPATGLATELDLKAITAKPTADNPQYNNKESWPTFVGDEYFQKEKWETARLLIWNIHGSAETVGGRRGGLDGRNPANWINAATGQPAKSIPGMDTDIILPDSDTPYTVDFYVKDAKVSYCRHVTIGRNAKIRTGGHRDSGMAASQCICHTPRQRESRPRLSDT